MSYKYILHQKSPLCEALQRVLQMFSIPADHIIAEGKHFAVKDGSMIHIGLLPLLTTLRATAANSELQAFIGTDAEIRPLVNQWVSAAILLSTDAMDEKVLTTPTPLAKQLFTDIERCVESFNLQKSFLAGTPRATIADFLLYAALHQHPSSAAEIRPSTLAWSRYAQSDAYLTPIIITKSAGAETDTTISGGKGNNNNNNNNKPIFVKPSEEEILRRRQEKEKEKQAKLAQAAASGSTTTAAASSSNVKDSGKTQKKGQQQPQSISLDPNNLDIRVGRFTNVKSHPEADSLFVEEMDLGTEKRTIVSGLVGHYKAEELEGSLCLAVCNLKPRPLKGITSQGMVLCASKEGSPVTLVRPPEGAQPGDRIIFNNTFDQTKLLETKQLSAKVMTELLGFLHTDNEGIVRWQDIPAHHTLGMLKVSEVTNAVVK